MKKLFFDVETTGFSYHRNAIHQISGCVDNMINETMDSFNFNARPHSGAIIEDKALAVSNVTKEIIMSYEPMETVHSKLVQILSRHCKLDYDKLTLIGYNNIRFDNMFLRYWFQRNGEKFDSFFHAKSLDVMLLAGTHLQKHRHKMKDFKLVTVARYLGLDVKEDQLHNANYDVKLTRDIYNIITDGKN